ncbi:uncharacterized protein LOC134533359 [Bacillus rossius redtenbacheri]|uniref:uncharacterized protein LOC134533359 n=1 Tax=Bacillus rossius redtenbacheri TaxID=93214 RepID=UPI002FDE62C3
MAVCSATTGNVLSLQRTHTPTAAMRRHLWLLCLAAALECQPQTAESSSGSCRHYRRSARLAVRPVLVQEHTPPCGDPAYFMFSVRDGAGRWADATCVLESDFGFNLKCRFKKSGLFRVRNLGGVKGYFGLGFTVGDELGLPESLSNSESAKRRSLAAGRISSGHSPVQKTNVTQLTRLPSPTRIASLTAYRPPLPVFKPIPPAMAAERYQHLLAAPALSRPQRLAAGVAAPGVPPFQELPASITRVQAAAPAAPAPPPAPQLVAVQVARAPAAFRQSLQAASGHFQARQDKLPADSALATRRLPPQQVSGADMQHTIRLLARAANMSEQAVAAAILERQQQLLQQQRRAAELAATTTTSTTTTARPHGSNLVRQYPAAAASKVMNAPKEYYPVGYDKNFDDNFVSRVELPDTSFGCGDQKHFPGLYADEDLGCMVFHVCAFTDDGLIMKSFLCPESTLFDQTILKCNWWFYVDCKSSAKLYDSNIPVSKSYQLMKALAFFSNYNKS